MDRFTTTRNFSTRPNSQSNSFQVKPPRVTLQSLQKKYSKGEKISMITAYDFSQASIVEKSPIDVILVGDSVGMVVLGHETTVPVEISDIIHHCKAVKRGAPRPLLVGDLPFGSYETSPDEGCKNALRIIKEGGMNAIKLEGGKEQVELIKRLTKANIAVMGHIGLRPQSINTLGNYRYVGNSPSEAKQLLEDAFALQEAGCFAIVLECVPEELSEYLTRHLSIPTIGVGAGKYTSGQVLVWHDLLGITDSCPSFCRRFANLNEIVLSSLEKFHTEVVENSFPSQEHSRSLKNSKTLRLIQEDTLLPTDSPHRKSSTPLIPLSLTLRDKTSKSSTTEKNPPRVPERIVVMGSGAMAMLIAAKITRGLANSSSRVVLYDPWYEDHIQSITRANGIFLQSNPHSGHLERITGNLSAASNEDQLLAQFGGHPADVAIILTKSYQLQLEPEKISFRQILAEDGVICSLQNGAGNKQLLQSISYGNQTILIGTTSNGAKVLQPGQVCHSGTGPTFIVCKNERDLSDANMIANLLNCGGISTEVTSDENVILEKVIINAAINPISALLEVTNGKIVQEPHLFDQIIEKVVEEGVRIRPNLYQDEASRKKRVKELVEKVKLVATNTSQNRSSMLSDISRGQETEIDFINGFLVRESLQRGYDAPTNALLTALIKAKVGSNSKRSQVPASGDIP